MFKPETRKDFNVVLKWFFQWLKITEWAEVRLRNPAGSEIAFG